LLYESGSLPPGRRRTRQPIGISSRRSPYQVVQLRLGLAGLQCRRTLKALADGESNPAALGALADERLRATPEQLCDALGACRELSDVYRRLLQMALEECRLIDEQIGKLDQELASLLSQHQDAVERLAEVPGLGVDSAQMLLKSARPPLPFPPGNVSRPGSVLAREKKRAPA
jgi:transposase